MQETKLRKWRKGRNQASAKGRETGKNIIPVSGMEYSDKI